VGLERGPLILVSTIEELLERKCSGSGLENRDYGRRGLAALTTRHHSISKKLALTSPTSGGPSVDIVRSRTQATEHSTPRQAGVKYSIIAVRISHYRTLLLIEYLSKNVIVTVVINP
jgi:hypothetical protein